jgi:transposase
METLYFLGIDVSKKTFCAALTVDGTNVHELQVENKLGSIKQFFDLLRQQYHFSLSQLIVCMEHTGIYGLPLLDYLIKAGIKVAVEPALQIRQSQGMTRGKTDKFDAKRIAQYACRHYTALHFWKPQRIVIQKLKALLVARERLIKIKVQLQIPITESQDYLEEGIRKLISKKCQTTLLALAKDISKIEQSIDLLIEEDCQIQEQLRWSTSVPGIGKITALNVIISTGEFQKINDAKKFACYSGIAPFEHSSGTSIRGKTRVSRLANMTLKKLLHMAAMSAIQFNPELKAFYQRKVSQGKNKMSVINAVRNKLISRVFVCIKNRRLYEKNYLPMLV